jgi:hypothetical protein
LSEEPADARSPDAGRHNVKVILGRLIDEHLGGDIGQVEPLQDAASRTAQTCWAASGELVV